MEDSPDTDESEWETVKAKNKKKKRRSHTERSADSPNVSKSPEVRKVRQHQRSGTKESVKPRTNPRNDNVKEYLATTIHESSIPLHDVTVQRGTDRIYVTAENYVYVIGETEVTSFRSGIRLPSIAVLSDTGTIVLTHPRRHHFQFHDQNGDKLLEYGKPGKQDGQFGKPLFVALDDENRIYVTDHELGRVSVHQSNGKFLRHIGGKTLTKPANIAVHNGLVYVLESEKSQIFVFDEKNALVKTIGETRLKKPSGVYVDSLGLVYVGNNEDCFRRIDVFTKDGELSHRIRDSGSEFGFIRALAMTSQDELIAVDSGQNKVLKMKLT